MANTLVKISSRLYNELGKPATGILTFTSFARQVIEFEFDEKKYHLFIRQAEAVLKEKGFTIVCHGWNEIDCHEWFIVKE